MIYHINIAFRTDFSIREENIIKRKNEFFEKIGSYSGIHTFAEKYDVEISPKKPSKSTISYESARVDSHLVEKSTPILFTILPGNSTKATIKEIFADSIRGHKILNEKFVEWMDKYCVLSLFNNTFATLSFDFKVETQKSEFHGLLDELEIWANSFAKTITNELYTKVLLPFFEELRKEDQFNFFTGSGHHPGFPDVISKDSELKLTGRVICGKPRSVSRVIISNGDSNSIRKIGDHWIISSGLKDELMENFSSTDEKKRVYLGWMNSLIINDREAKIVEDALFSLNLMLFYYYIFESLNLSLTDVISLSHKKRSVKETRRFKQMLENIIFTADNVKVNFNDVSQGLQRNRAYFFNELSERWTLDLVLENIQNKIRICKDNIQKIYQQAFNRSQKFAELLLFFLSSVALLEFFKGIAEFTHKADTLDDKVWGVYSVAKQLDPNSMLWLGFSTIVFLFLIYSRILKEKNG